METRTWRKFDFVLLGITILLLSYGVLMIFSATAGSVSIDDSWRKQLLYSFIGVVLVLFISSIDYRFYDSLDKILYFVMIVLLAFVFILGTITHGTLRWIDLIMFNIQPSELSKIIVVVCLATAMARHEEEVKKFRFFLMSLAIVLPPMALIYLQPDLGTMLTLGFIWLCMVVMVGGRFLHLSFFAGGLTLMAPIVWNFVLKDYMRSRLLLFLNPEANPDEYFNVRQALISIGSGGLFGKGYGSGTQSQLHFLRVRHTDFIFSVIGEELGLIGGILLFLLFLAMLWRIISISQRADDTLGRMIAIGVAALIFCQTSVNIGVNLGLLPVTGMPLPFISYGGSSLTTFLIGIGLVESVAMRHKKLEFN
jgi:rod shape determining protein RodA